MKHSCRIAIAITAIFRPIETNQTEIVIIETFVVLRPITGGFRSPRITTSPAIWRFLSRSRLALFVHLIYSAREFDRRFIHFDVMLDVRTYHREQRQDLRRITRKDGKHRLTSLLANYSRDSTSCLGNAQFHLFRNRSRTAWIGKTYDTTKYAMSHKQYLTFFDTIRFRDLVKTNIRSQTYTSQSPHYQIANSYKPHYNSTHNIALLRNCEAYIIYRTRLIAAPADTMPRSPAN